MIVTLKREAHLTDATVGVLEISGRKFLTLEQRERANGEDKHDVCLPPGAYRLTPTQRAAGDKCYAISNPALRVWQRPSDVPPSSVTDARSAVYLAAGFSTDDLVGGHVAVGKQRQKIRGVWALDQSGDALNEIRTLIGSVLDITLIVEEPL